MAVAFWVNFVALSAVVHFIQQQTRARLSDEPALLFYALLAQFAVFRLLVYPWQLVGALRACERAVSGYGRSFWPRAFQLLLSLSMVLVFIDGFGVLHAGYAWRAAAPVQRIVREHTLSLHAGNTLVYLQGYVDFGATADLRQVLEANPAVTAIVLDSRGGPVYEARGLARLIKARGLDTYSMRECSSACVTAFVAGKHRWLAPHAKLGFHRYRLDADHRIPPIDSEQELRKDLAFYRAQGIDTAALAEILETPHGQIWYPTRKRLLQSGVIHGVAEAPF